MKRIIVLGDSTASVKEKDARPETGWAEFLFLFLPDYEIKNFARNGRSTKTCIEEGIFSQALSVAEKDDIIFIQFGHNDEKINTERGTDPFTSFAENLCYMATSFSQKGAKVVLLSPIPRRIFKNGYLENTHGLYYPAVAYASYKSGVDYVDVTLPLSLYLEKLGECESKKLFNKPDEGDNSHLNSRGAREFAFIILNEIENNTEVFHKKTERIDMLKIMEKEKTN